MRDYYVSQPRTLSQCCVILLAIIGIAITICALPLFFSYKSNIEDVLKGQDIAVEYEESSAFNEFKAIYKRNYESVEEEAKRKAIFVENYRKIKEFNLGKNNFELGVNNFADLTRDEYRERYLSKREEIDIDTPPQETTLTDNREIDWVKKGKVSPIRDQGNCGSCWAFSSVSAAESIHAIRDLNNEVKRLSEQHIVDCCKTERSDGCNGGERYESFECMTQTGIALGKDYPYKAQNDVCNTKVPIFFHLQGKRNVTPDNNVALADAVLTRPVSVGINADNFAFMFYKKGIIDKGCPHTEINHGVVAVGLGKTDQDVLFWKVRNSWGKNWGDNGYVYIKRQIEDGPGVCAIGHKGCMPLYKEK